jgi:hypothetical protein
MVDMKLLVLLAFLVACGGSKPRPEPVQNCPAPPRIVTPEEVKAADDKSAYDDAYVRLEDLIAIADRQIAEALEELRALDARACACVDAACAAAIQEDFEAWAWKHKDVKGSQAQADEAGRVAEHIRTCIVSVMP